MLLRAKGWDCWNTRFTTAELQPGATEKAEVSGVDQWGKTQGGLCLSSFNNLKTLTS